jgi:ribosomal protein S18 acetylase RimI-like enzyme
MKILKEINYCDIINLGCDYMIKIVDDELLSKECDKLLTKLIKDEKNYNNFIDKNFKVKDYFKNIILNDKNLVLCYEKSDEVIGYIFFKYIKSEDGNGYLIDGLYVEEEHRNKGIAKSLIETGLKEIEKKQYDFIDINVMYQNKIAIKLYESFGFDVFSLKLRKNVKSFK